MRGFLIICGALFLAGAVFFAQYIVSDIQVTIVVVLVVGGVLSVGLAAVLKALEDFQRAAKKDPS